MEVIIASTVREGFKALRSPHAIPRGSRWGPQEDPGGLRPGPLKALMRMSRKTDREEKKL